MLTTITRKNANNYNVKHSANKYNANNADNS